MISIVHRLKIIMTRDGDVVEEGNHTELMTKQGAYADLVQLQDSSIITSLKWSKLLSMASELE